MISWHSMGENPEDKINTYLLAVKCEDGTRTSVVGLWSNRSHGSHGDLLEGFRWFTINPANVDCKYTYAWADKPEPCAETKEGILNRL